MKTFKSMGKAKVVLTEKEKKDFYYIMIYSNQDDELPFQLVPFPYDPNNSKSKKDAYEKAREFGDIRAKYLDTKLEIDTKIKEKL